MKKKLMKLSLVFCMFLGITSCNKKVGGIVDANPNEPLTDEIEMKGFMVGGIYAMYGFGGVAEVEKIVNAKSSERQDLIEAYKQIMVFSFLKEDGDDCKKTLKDFWNIDSKTTLIATLNDLKGSKKTDNPHKAWDYARLVNNVNMAYAADYLTETESQRYVSETLILAQKEFRTWEDFLKDFNIGRIIWNPESLDNADFTKISGEMLQNELYKNLPLN